MRKYNTPGPHNPTGGALIFNTYQAYLTDSHARLVNDMERARRDGYTFAAKLVRVFGAEVDGGTGRCFCYRYMYLKVRDCKIPVGGV